MTRLRGFFALVAARGGGSIGARELDAALAGDGAEARSALRALGIVRDAPPVTSWPCPEAGCAREVRTLPAFGGKRAALVAVCTRAEEGCEAVALEAADVAQAVIALDALATALADALKLAAVEDVPRRRRPNEPWLVGTEGAAAVKKRDVYFVQQPRAAMVRALIAEHAVGSWAREARVLVPTRAGIEPEMAKRAAATRGRVTIEALEDVVGVEDKRLVEARGPKRAAVAELVEAPAKKTRRKVETAERAVARCAALEGYPEATRWGDVTLFDVDQPDLVGVLVTGARRARRLSCVDLGLADTERRPIQAFELLLIVCKGNGIFGTRRFGSQSNGKRILSELRKGLTGAFGLGEDPFEKYSRREKSWKPKFRAMERGPGEE